MSLDPILFTHIDLDGAGCAVLFKRRHPEAQIHYYDYPELDQAILDIISVQTDTPLWITDICPTREVCRLLDAAVKAGKPIKLFDHHLQTSKLLSRFSWATHEIGVSGTEMLIHEFRMTTSLEEAELAKAITAWDTWLLDSPHRQRGEMLNTLFQFMGIENFVEKFSIAPEADSSETLCELVRYIEYTKEYQIKRVLCTQLNQAERITDGAGNTFKILFSAAYISEIAHRALNDPEEEDLKYVVIVNPLDESCHLRSKQDEDVDVSKIAQRFRGGGHKHAAGFKITMRSGLTRLVAGKLVHMV